MTANVSIARPPALHNAWFSPREHAPSWGPSLWDDVPTDAQDDGYEYDLELVPTRHRFGKRFLELTTAPDAPLRRRAAGGVNLPRLLLGAALWLSGPVVVVGCVAMVVL